MFGIPDVLGIKSAAIAGSIALLIGASAGTYAGYRLELGAYQRHLTADASAMTKAVQTAADRQHHIDLLNQGDAESAAYYRGQMDAQRINLVMGVPANVTIEQDKAASAADRGGCITYGFVRLLVAGERHVPAGSLQLPSGESVDGCTALEPSGLASSVAQDLAAGASDAHQLDALIAAVRRNDAIATQPNH